ncbi:B12-binding domain-containing radical SAM protein [Paenibacillus medicaginis]|uniref:B12-binding domain-containing radical SAM protein n=1 Tax=Paenibacillus medicaginis TaxID=1470560 RepID=A0ABV5BZ93_9BACL
MDCVLVQCLPQNELYDARYQSENLALGYLSSSLRKNGFTVAVLDAHLEELAPQQTVDAILRYQPMIVGFSSSAQDSISSTFEVAKLLRASGYQGHITIGGHFPTYEHQKFLEYISELDSVVRGEGELTIVEIVQRVREGRNLIGVKGVTCRDEANKIVANSDRELVEVLDTLPLPDRPTLHHLMSKNRRVSILASRGCYARCTFCSIQTFFNYRPRRVRKTENVVSEMKALYDQGVRKFKFVDDLFMDPSKKSQEWVKDLCYKLKEADMTDLNIWLQVRAVCVKEDIFKELLGVGLKKVFLGLESGHADTLKRYRKDITPEQNLEAVQVLKRVGVPEISIGMMIFEPDLTVQGIRDNIEFLKKIGSFDIRDVTGRFLPYAATPLTEQLLQENRIKRNSWYDIGSYDFLDPTVGLLFEMVNRYSDIARPSLKAVYQLDGLVRHLEARVQRHVSYYKEYSEIRRQVENYINEHGQLMLHLVQDTVEAADRENGEISLKQWYDVAERMFKDVEKTAYMLIAEIRELVTELELIDGSVDSIHIAEVKVLGTVINE